MATWRGGACVVSSHRRRPSPTVQRVGVFALFTRLHLGSLALRPAVLHHRNSGPPVIRTPLRDTTKVHEQLLWRDLNPQVNQPVMAYGQFTCESCRGRSSVTYGVQVFADDLASRPARRSRSFRPVSPSSGSTRPDARSRSIDRRSRPPSIAPFIRQPRESACFRSRDCF